MIHSISVRVEAVPCELATGRPRPSLRPYVVGYGGFRTGTAEPPRRRVLPLSLTTLIVDFAGPGLVTGPRDTPLVCDTGWRYGIAVGLTSAGVSALLGVPMRELAGTGVPPDDLLGRRARRLADRVAGERGWAARFAVLDEELSELLRPRPDPDPSRDGMVSRAWWRIQESAGRLRIDELADELGVARRRLEAGFQRRIGLPPKTVARIARFQHVALLLSRPSATLDLAGTCGYADQPHLTRDVRAMSGLTPLQLRAFLQYNGRPAG
ncbi:helix-turn-helix transcriptional regulator [Spirillospora sp. NPDC029432]|uniref:helix-turn-helix transcriptional regulator n=1 Tax=Spirillospora sp. NPDC029432 TaxID=3154599 RepID=UPI003454E9A3